MKNITTESNFKEILEATEPRTPTMVMRLDVEEAEGPAWDRMVGITLYDNLTCNEIGSYDVDPFSALHLLHRASFFAIDGERTDEMGDFAQELYSVINAWAGKRLDKLAQQNATTNIQAAIECLETGDLGAALSWITAEARNNDVPTCKVSDVLDFTAASLKNNPKTIVTVDGVLWQVIG